MSGIIPINTGPGSSIPSDEGSVKKTKPVKTPPSPAIKAMKSLEDSLSTSSPAPLVDKGKGTVHVSKFPSEGELEEMMGELDLEGKVPGVSGEGVYEVEESVVESSFSEEEVSLPRVDRSHIEAQAVHLTEESLEGHRSLSDKIAATVTALSSLQGHESLELAKDLLQEGMKLGVRKGKELAEKVLEKDSSEVLKDLQSVSLFLPKQLLQIANRKLSQFAADAMRRLDEHLDTYAEGMHAQAPSKTEISKGLKEGVSEEKVSKQPSKEKVSDHHKEGISGSKEKGADHAAEGTISHKKEISDHHDKAGISGSKEKGADHAAEGTISHKKEISDHHDKEGISGHKEEEADHATEVAASDHAEGHPARSFESGVEFSDHSDSFWDTREYREYGVESESELKPIVREILIDLPPLAPPKSLADEHTVKTDFITVKRMIDHVTEAIKGSTGSDIPVKEPEVREDLDALLEAGKAKVKDLLEPSLILEELGEQAQEAYHGTYDEDYAQKMLSELPGGSGLLFSWREPDNSLKFGIVTSDFEGKLVVYDEDFSKGFEAVTDEFRTDLGIRLVGYKEGQMLIADPVEWSEHVESSEHIHVESSEHIAVSEEISSAESGEIFTLPSSEAMLDDSIIRNNQAIAESSTYYQGMRTEEEIETFFRETKSRAGTGLLSYNVDKEAYCASYVGIEGGKIVYRHEVLTDVEEGMEELQDAIFFLRNEVHAKDFLGEQEPYYFGEMEHEYVARFLQETPSDDRGILYSKMRPDGRVEFFAAINKTVFELDEEKHTSSCLIYEIGYRPDQKEYWQEFEADNGVGALRSKNVVSKEEVPEKSKKDQIVAGMKVKLASLGKYSPFKKEN